MNILEETLAFLIDWPELADREIRSVFLNRYFTVVELDDGSVGAAMGGFLIPLESLLARQAAIRPILRRDPLLREYTKPGEAKDEVAISIRLATASALSARLLRRHDDPAFMAESGFPHHFFQQIESAVVIGMGGLLPYLVRHTSARKIHVSDLLYPIRREVMDNQLAQLRRDRPGVEISLSDGSDTDKRLAQADFVSITGSTLANGTLEPLLAAARNCGKIVLQGQSAAIHPARLFEAGVDLVATTLKPREIATTAFWDPTGKSLRPLLEGELRWTYLWPRRRAGNRPSRLHAISPRLQRILPMLQSPTSRIGDRR